MPQILRRWMLLLHAAGISPIANAFTAQSDTSDLLNPTTIRRSIASSSNTTSSIPTATLSRSASLPQATLASNSSLVSKSASLWTQSATQPALTEFEILNDTFWATLVTQPPPTSTSQPHIWTVPVYTGSIDDLSVAECYASWQTYFRRLSSASTSYSTSEYTTTVTSTVDPGVTGYVEGTTTQTWLSTVEYVNGAFTFSVEPTTRIITETGLLLQYGAPFPTTFTQLGTASSPIIINPPPQPTCALPSVVSQCQSKWLSYLDTWYPTPYYATNQPKCQFASMSSSACWSLRDKYVTYWNDWGTAYPYLSNGYTEISTTEYYGNYVTDFAWPKYTSLAPACSLGCARCAMTGGTIQLLYWPATSSYDTSDGPVTAVVGDSTLTYPTVYVSYREIFASDSCGPVGPSITNTIVAIPTPSQISSIYGTVSLTVPAFVLLPPALLTTAFNITDLSPPVPYSIYEKQPWCQTLLNAWSYRHYAYGPNASTTTCPTTEPYKPILYLPAAILNSMDPLWATCSGDVHGVYDPPSALRPALSVAPATLPTQAITTPTMYTTTSLVPSPAATPTSTPSPTSLSSGGPADPFHVVPDQVSPVVPLEPSPPSLPPDMFPDSLPPDDISHSIPFSTSTPDSGSNLPPGPDPIPDSPLTHLSPGQQTNFQGHTISVASVGNSSIFLVIDGTSTLQIPAPAPNPHAAGGLLLSPPDPANGQTISINTQDPSPPNGRVFSIDGQAASAIETDRGVVVMGPSETVTLAWGGRTGSEGGTVTALSMATSDGGGGNGGEVVIVGGGGKSQTVSVAGTSGRADMGDKTDKGTMVGMAGSLTDSRDGLRWNLRVWAGLTVLIWIAGMG